MNALKYTDKMASELSEVLKGLKSAVSGLSEKAEENGTFRVVISTEDVDRHGEIVKQDGLDTTHFENNPVVLFGHNHYALPIGVCTSIKKENGKTIAEGVFASNPVAQGQRELYEMGIAATSIGFIEKERDGNVIVESELLEFSFVPIPANPHVHALKEAGLNIEELAVKGLLNIEIKEGDTIETAADEPQDEPEDEETPDDEETPEEDENEAPEGDDETPDEDGDNDEVDSDDETGDNDEDNETTEEKILGALSLIDKRLSVLENSKNADESDVAGSEDEEGGDDDVDPDDDDVSEAMKFVRNRRKTQKAVKALQEVLADMAKEARNHY